MISVLGIIPRILSKRMRSGFKGPLSFIVPVSGQSSAAIRTVAFCVTALPGSDVGSAAMNILWISLAMADISAIPTPKSGWSSLRDGCAERFKKSSLSSLSLQHSQDPPTLFSLGSLASFVTESLRLGSLEDTGDIPQRCLRKKLSDGKYRTQKENYGSLKGCQGFD